MKKFCFLMLLTASLTTAAQSHIATPLKQGKVVYEHVVRLQGMLRRPDGEMDQQMPQQFTEQFELLFAGNRWLWQPLPDAAREAAAVSDAPGNTLRMARWDGADVVYCDFETGQTWSERELRTKNYIVEDSIATLSWKLHDNEKELLGYKTKKATAFRYGTRQVMTMENGKLNPQELPDTTVLVAWFAPAIPVPAGPGHSNGLPGLILELDESNGRSVYKAVEVTSKVNTASIRAPKGSKQISKAEFQREQKKFMDEMQRQMQNGGRISMPLPPGNQ